ncbi:MAG: hypothetical protein HOO96_34175 [Polyangiaceae bacterium]|nr:hypothetical protein [Polyangiaceae bacterium]
MADGFPAARAHGPFETPFDDVFMVRGTSHFAPLLHITRNMIVLRQGDDLTLLNSVRLSDVGERDLERLGTVRHLVKLGHFHGMDDAYYAKRYAPVVWATSDATHARGVTTARRLTPGESGPVADMRVFTFERATRPEACIVLGREGGILVTCDSVQNWGAFEGCSGAAKVVLRALGFAGEARIGPGWRRFAEPRDGGGLGDDFRRLLTLPFRHLVPAHGHVLRDRAKEALAARVAESYPRRS